MDWPYWLLIVVAVAQLRGWLSRKLGRVEGWHEGWHEGWDAREALAERAERNFRAYHEAKLRQARGEAPCVFCGKPTMHDGNTCYACAHAPTVVTDDDGEPE